MVENGNQISYLESYFPFWFDDLNLVLRSIIVKVLRVLFADSDES